MKITDASIQKPVFAWMMMAALMIFGWISFQRMGVSLLPDVDMPNVSVNVSYEGAAPEAMEVDVVDILEDAVSGISGVKNVTSTSRSGSASINVEFSLEKNIDIAMQDVQNAISNVIRRLPEGVDPPTISKSNSDDNPIIWAAVWSEKMPSLELMELVNNQIKSQITTVEGVAEVFLGGFVDPSLRVFLTQDKLKEYELTVGDVLSTISSEHAESPAGRIQSEGREYGVRTMGEAQSIMDFRNLPINRRGGAPMYIPLSLSDIADVDFGFAEVRRLSRTNRIPAIGLGVRKQRGSNAVAVADAVKERVAEIAKQLPEGVQIGIRSDSTAFIKEAVAELNHTLVMAAILTAFVCWLFLGSFQATLNVILAIPTSILGTFIVLKFLGFTLNTFTLLGLSLAIGIVVDDAIMVLENIYRHRELGKDPVNASRIGTREISFAAMAATAAIVAIFLPIAYMDGIVGKFLYQFGVTISVAVSISLLEALTLTPMRLAYFGGETQHRGGVGRASDRLFTWLVKYYERVLHVTLRHRYITIFAGILLAGIGIVSTMGLKKEFAPPQDQGFLMIRMNSPTGSALEYTDARVKKIEDVIASRPETDSTFVAIGGFGGGDVDTAFIFLTLKKPKDRPKDAKLGRSPTQQDMQKILREELAKVEGIRSFVMDPSTGGIGGRGRSSPVEFSIVGPDWKELIEISKKFSDELEKTGQVVDLDSDYRPGLFEYGIIPNRKKAAERGVSVSEIDQTVGALFGGVIAGQFSKDARRFDIRVRLDPGDRNSVEDIKKVRVRNNRGELVSLMDIVTIEERPSMQSITRKNRERAISINANLKGGMSQREVMQKVEVLGKTLLPDKYRVIASGSSETMNETAQAIAFALILGLVVGYMVLASQFNSFLDPITVLVALYFGVAGAFMGLYLFGQSINLYSLIGLILLMGIAKKNSILLVDYTNTVRDTGLGVREALLVACPIRLRPILMTSMATAAGIMPAALAWGPGAESRIPMAIAILGGVIVSTFMTLIVVPSLYEVLARKKREVIVFQD